MAKKQRKKQIKPEDDLLLQLEQGKKDVWKAEQKVVKAQAELELSRIHLRALERELEIMRLSRYQVEQAVASAPQPAFSHGASEMSGQAPSPRNEISTALPEKMPAASAEEQQAVVFTRGLYAYGLVSKDAELPAIAGLDKQGKVYPVVGKDIGVVVSEIDIDQFQRQIKNLSVELSKDPTGVQSGLGEILQAHEGVIDTIMQSTTVVPLKFGTILRDAAAALKMLQDNEDQFKLLLDKFSGKVEWGLKVYADKQALTKYTVQADPQLAGMEKSQEKLSRGAAYMLGRKREEDLKDRVSTRLAQITEVIFHELGNDATEAKVNNTLPQSVTGRKKEMILNAVYLLNKEKVDHFKQQGEKFKEEYTFLGLDLEFSGPWPPYNFT